MSSVGSSGPVAGKPGAAPSVADAITKGEQQIAERLQDVLESGGDKKELLLLSQAVQRQKEAVNMASNVSKAYHEMAMAMIRNIRG